MTEDQEYAATADAQPAETAPPAEGDWRGPFGYGHHAYKPDPAATYVFSPGEPRVLPVLPKNRWR